MMKLGKDFVEWYLSKLCKHPPAACILTKTFASLGMGKESPLHLICRQCQAVINIRVESLLEYEKLQESANEAGISSS